MIVDIEAYKVDVEKDDSGSPWYNVHLEMCLEGRASVRGVVSLGSNLRAMGDSAQSWLSRSLYSEIAFLSGPKFSDVADQLEAFAASFVRESVS